MASKRVRGSHVCKACEMIMIPNKLNKGSFGIELLVWLASLMLVPFTVGISLLVALSYSIWRISNKIEVCEKCKSTEIVPIDSPVGQKIIKAQGLIEDI